MPWLTKKPPDPPVHQCPLPRTQGTRRGRPLDPVGAGSVWQCPDCGVKWTKQGRIMGGGWMSEVQGEPPPDIAPH